MSNKLTLADISDLRQYEREREEFREKIIDLKKKRRVAVGPYVTFLFESRDTMRFQIQEMARVEKIISDEAIEAELRAYNPLIPESNMLCSTMFIELTTDELLREWLPKLVGIHEAVSIVLANGERVGAYPEAGHAKNLTRDDITSSVHYLQWTFSNEEISQLEAGPATLALTLNEYSYDTELSSETIAQLLGDLRS